MAMPQPPHKADGRTRKQRRKVLVEAGVEPNFPNPMVVPQIVYIHCQRWGHLAAPYLETQKELIRLAILIPS